MSSKFRSQSYSIEEDVHLCHVYLDISQNPIIGINQSKDKFWVRVDADYHSEPKFASPHRPKRSLQKRMSLITSSISKLKGCIRQIETLNPSGASEQDILNRAKILLAEDAKYQRGFKFDHVWHILKDIEKFDNDNVEVAATRRSNQEYINIGSSQPNLRPIGVKQAKEKRKKKEHVSKMINQDDELVKQLKVGNDMFKSREENRFLFKDLNSIVDPIMRDFLRCEQIKIMQKRSQSEGFKSFLSQGEGSQYDRHGSQDVGQGSQFNRSQYDGHGTQNVEQGSQYAGHGSQGVEKGSQAHPNVFNQFNSYFGGPRTDLRIISHCLV